MIWQRFRAVFGTIFRLLLFSAVVSAILAPEWPAFQDESGRLDVIVGQRRFDYLVWELNALATKANGWLNGGQAYLDEAGRKQLVLDYLERLRDVRRQERTISAIYADPNVPDPDLVTQQLQSDVNRERAELARWQPLVEAIVQEQVAAVLVEEGFGLLGHAWPPVQMHMTPLPSLLIVSPREQIRQLYAISLVHGLSTPEQELMEEAVYERLDRSALVVPIGGVGLFPSMIVETSNMNFLADVVAHEWAHHWLTLRPLGINYYASVDLRTINETVASVVGAEIGLKVIARFYPEFLPPPPAPGAVPPPTPAEPPPFDFRAEMRLTRVTVDELLAAGRIDEAEAYMEERRRLFVANGYNIRRLNQAYFAFYGAYADTPGATGSDPIGPAVQALRAASPTLRIFMDRVATVTSREALEAALAAAQEESR